MLLHSLLEREGCTRRPIHGQPNDTRGLIDLGRGPKPQEDRRRIVRARDVNRYAVYDPTTVQDNVFSVDWPHFGEYRRGHHGPCYDPCPHQSPYAKVQRTAKETRAEMSADARATSPRLHASRVQGHRARLRALKREVRWLKRTAVLLACLNIALLGAVLWGFHWETFGG